KYGMTEQAAIDNGLYNYIEKYRQKFNIEKVKDMRFDILFNRPFTDEYDISAGDFELKLEDGSTKKFGFTTYKYDVDSKNPNLVHVILYDTANNYKDIGMDVGYELYTNNLKNALFSEFHINCGDGIDLDIKPEKISELMLTYSDAIT
uniref:hypothetical protein n=1 Tax=Anaerovibrio sp. TaxID=1872532 RepID=UPI00388D6B01